MNRRDARLVLDSFPTALRLRIGAQVEKRGGNRYVFRTWQGTTAAAVAGNIKPLLLKRIAYCAGRKRLALRGDASLRVVSL